MGSSLCGDDDDRRRRLKLERFERKPWEIKEEMVEMSFSTDAIVFVCVLVVATSCKYAY